MIAKKIVGSLLTVGFACTTFADPPLQVRGDSGTTPKTCEGVVFSLSAFGNGPNSREFLLNILGKGAKQSVAMLVGSIDGEKDAVIAMWTLLVDANRAQKPVLVSYVTFPGTVPRVVGVYTPPEHYEESSYTQCGVPVAR